MKCIGYLIPDFPVVSETFISTEIKAIQQLGHPLQAICLRRSSQVCQAGDEALAKSMLCVADVTPWQVLWQLMRLLIGVLISLAGQRHTLRSWRQGYQFLVRQRGVRPRSLLLQAIKVSYLLDRAGCDHLHCHFAWAPASNGIVAARLSAISVSFTCHGSDVYKTPQDLQLKLQSADFVVAVCKRMQAEFQALAPDTAIELIPCGVDTDVFRPRPAGLSGWSRWLFVGRLSETKGVDYLLQALALLPAADRPQIDIAGDGPMATELRRQQRQLGLGRQVDFLGAVSRAWLSNNLNRYQAVVLPFCRADSGVMDTGPLVLKEAMACEVPILTSRLMANGEILDATSAWICAPNDAEDLADTITELQEHLLSRYPSPRYTSLQLKQQRASQRLQQQFSARRSAECLSRLYEQARIRYPLASKPGGGAYDKPLS